MIVRALALSCVGLAIACAAAAQEPAADALLADLPFLEAGPNQVKIDLASEGGRSLPLLLDTGALQSFATAGGARALGIPLRRNKQTPYRRETRLGRDVELHVDTRRGDTGQARGGDYALVGASFLSRYVVEIDFPRRRVRFYDPDRFQVPESDPPAVVLPMRHGTQPVVEIELGGVRVPAILATGAPGTLIVPGGWAADAAAQIAIDAEETAKLELPPGSGPMQAARAALVRLGGFEEREVPLLIAPQGVWGAGPRSEALVGVDFLKRFVLRIDYARRRLWLRDGPPPPPADPPPVSAPPPPPGMPEAALGLG